MLQRTRAWHVLLGSCLCVTPLAAQQGAPTRAAVRGVVISAADGAPLADVLLCINPAESAGEMMATAAHCFRSAVSDSLGRYHIEHLPPGAYALDAARLGYRPQRVLVEARQADSVAVWLALAAQPVPLEPLVLRAHSVTRAVPATGLSAATSSLVPLDVGDVHYLTDAGPTAAAGVGEPDLLRALHRLPGVTTRSDYTAELWTRGAPWYQTRVRFDGVPLYQPLHGMGAFSGFASAAIGSLVFRPGPGSAAGAGGAAGTVELRSRRAQGSGGINTRMDLSLVGATLSLDQRIAEGAVGWAATARRTHIDWFSRLASRAARTPRRDVPLAFWDVAAAADARIGEGATLSFSTLLQRDALEGSDSAQAHWGDTAAQLTLDTRRTRHTLGISSHDNAVPRRLTLAGTWLPYAHGEATRSSIGYVGLSGEVTGPLGWRAGYAATLHHTGYTGPAFYPVPRPASTVAAAGGAPARDGNEELREEARLPMLAAWAEYVWPLPVRLSTGLRLEAGPVIDGSGVRWSPHLAATYRLAPGVAARAAAGRTWQYVHSVMPAGVHVASLSSGHHWLLAGAAVPALRADAASLGVVAEPTTFTVLRVTAFGRTTAGMVLPDPRPGPLLLRADRVTGVNRAAGVETALALATSQITADVAYTYTSSDLRAAGLRYAASAHVPHALDVAVRLRAHERLGIAAAFTHTSGIPYTRVFGNAAGCDGTSCDDVQPVPWAGEPNAARAPPYESLDLLLDWTPPLPRVDARVYVQLRNALGHNNATVYTGVSHCGAQCPAGVQVQDRLERGLPRLPVFGVHVRF